MSGEAYWYTNTLASGSWGISSPPLQKRKIQKLSEEDLVMHKLMGNHAWSWTDENNQFYSDGHQHCDWCGEIDTRPNSWGSGNIVGTSAMPYTISTNSTSNVQLWGGGGGGAVSINWTP